MARQTHEVKTVIIPKGTVVAEGLMPADQMAKIYGKVINLKVGTREKLIKLTEDGPQEIK